MQAGMHWTSSCWQGWQVGIAGRRTVSPNGCSKPQLLMPLCHGRCRHRLHSLLPRPACTTCSHHHGCRWLHFWQALLQVTVQDVAAVAAVAAPDINGLPTCGVIQHNGAGHPPGAGRHIAAGPPPQQTVAVLLLRRRQRHWRTGAASPAQRGAASRAAAAGMRRQCRPACLSCANGAPFSG